MSKDHIKSEKHISLKRKDTEYNDKNGAPSAQKTQTTMHMAFNNACTAKELRNSVADDFVFALISANIPLEKADNPVLKQFLI